LDNFARQDAFSRRALTAAPRDHATAMSDAEMDAKLDELDRLLNDPEVKMDPHRVWSLLAEISRPAPQPRPVVARPN